MEFRAVIFDLDATLIYTYPAYRYLVVGKALRKLGKPEESIFESDIDDFWFLSDKDREQIIKERWHLDPEEQFWPVFREFETTDLRKQYSRPYEDVKILGVLKDKKKKKTAIVSAAPDNIIELETGLLNHNFDAIIRAQLARGIEPKPSPQGLERCLDILQVAKQNAMYVGDAKADMEMARDAGVYRILIGRGEYNFGNVEADLTISSLNALEIIV